jgi:hypothetical protein
MRGVPSQIVEAPAGPLESTLANKRILITGTLRLRRCTTTVCVGSPDLHACARWCFIGASAGIGRATALSFAAAGARVALVARGRERLQQVVAELPAGQAVALPADLAQADQAARAVHEAVSARGVAHVMLQ